MRSTRWRPSRSPSWIAWSRPIERAGGTACTARLDGVYQADVATSWMEPACAALVGALEGSASQEVEQFEWNLEQMFSVDYDSL